MNQYNSYSDIDNIPISGNPINNDTLVYQNGEFVYLPYGGGSGSGITSIINSGIGQTLINNGSAPTAILKSIFAGSGIQILSTTTTITIQLDISISNQFLYSNGTNIIGRNAIESCNSLTSSFPIYSNTTSNNANFRGLEAGTAISLVNTGNNIRIVNSGSTNTVNVVGGISLISLGAGSPTCFLNQIVPGPGMNIVSNAGAINITNNGVRTVSNAVSTINSLISSTSTANNILLKTIAAGSNVNISDNGTSLTINTTGSGSANTIYNSNGTFNSIQRIVSGQNPNDIASNILWDGLIPGYNSSFMTPQNVPIGPNPSYSGILDPSLLMASTFNGSQGKFIFSGWNYLSQKIEVKLPDVFGEAKEVFALYTDLNSLKTFMIHVKLCDIENNIFGFCAEWEFCINSHDLGLGWLLVKPTKSVLCNSTGNENFYNLIIRQIGNGILFAFTQSGLSTGAFISRYQASFYSWGPGLGSIDIFDNLFTSGSLFPYYPPGNELVNQNDFNIPVNGQFEYKKYGSDLRLSFCGSAQQLVNGSVQAVLSIFFNGQPIMDIQINADSVSNVNCTINKIAILKYMDLVSTGALLLTGPTSYTYSLSNGNYKILHSQTLIEYC